MLAPNPKQGTHSRNAVILLLIITLVVVVLLLLVTFKKKISLPWGGEMKKMGIRWQGA